MLNHSVLPQKPRQEPAPNSVHLSAQGWDALGLTTGRKYFAPYDVLICKNMASAPLPQTSGHNLGHKCCMIQRRGGELVFRAVLHSIQVDTCQLID